MKNVSKLLLTVAFLVSATAIQAYNAAATQELQQLIDSKLAERGEFANDKASAEKIKNLIANGANPSLVTTRGNLQVSPLAVAVYANDLDAVKAVVNAGAAIQKRKDAEGKSVVTPLSTAISGGSRLDAIAEFLIAQGQFDPNDLGAYLQEARGYGNNKIADLLIEQGAQLTKAKL